MKAIKKNMKLIVGIVIGIILGCFGMTYAAYLYNSSDVVYKKTSGTETSVQSALNELYNKRTTLTTNNSNNYVTWARDKKSLSLNGDNYYKGTINTSAAYEAGSNSMPHRIAENWTCDGKFDPAQYYHIHFPAGWYNRWDGASCDPEVRIPYSQAPNTQIWKDAYNAGYSSGSSKAKVEYKTVTLNVTYTTANYHWTDINTTIQSSYSNVIGGGIKKIWTGETGDGHRNPFDFIIADIDGNKINFKLSVETDYPQLKVYYLTVAFVGY